MAGRMRSSSIRLILLFCSVLALSACPSKKRSAKPATTQVKIVLMGDPNKVIEGATLDSKIDFSYFAGLQTLKLRAVADFSEKEELTLGAVVSQESIEKENSPTEPGERDQLIEMSVTSSAVNAVALRSSDLDLDLSNGADGRPVAFAKLKGQQVSLEILHFSVSEDGQEMSLLTRYMKPKGGVTISAIWFTKKFVSRSLTIGDTQYNYLNGPGVKSVWPNGRPIQLSAYGPNSQQILDVIKNSVTQWNSLLAGLRKISLGEQQQGFPPFSDLKYHGIYYIDSLKTEPNDSEATFGATVTIISNSTIIDSDVLIFKNELAKDPSEWASNLNRTVLHEMGHLLGLDHKFKDPKTQISTPSIMSYDFSDGGILTEYDRGAIKELYK